ncbi:MAG: helix-turn-helix domain-containing protein [Clostridiales bacterium]|nr:helix-turn-helix domain-containing protein [Clostridiales bacterium]
MAYIYDEERYSLKDSHLKVESLFINDIHKCTGVYVFPFHQHDDLLELSIVVQGEELIEFKDGSYRAKAGDLIIKNASALHQETAGTDEELIEISAGISGVKIPGLPNNCLCDEDIIPVIPAGESAAVLIELFHTIENMYRQSVTMYSQVIQLALKTFVSISLMTVDRYGVPKERKKKKEDQQIAEIVKYIDDNYSNQISLDDIAKSFFISPYYLSRKFKAEVGYTVNQYIQNLRLGKAEQRLAFEDTSIKKIAAECGFENLKYFYSVFKVKTGHTPNEFRCLLRPDADGEE